MYVLYAFYCNINQKNKKLLSYFGWMVAYICELNKKAVELPLESVG